MVIQYYLFCLFIVVLEYSQNIKSLTPLGGSAGPPAMQETWVWIPGLGRSPREGNGYPLQHSGLENSMSCIIHGVAKSQTLLSDFHSFIVTISQGCRSSVNLMSILFLVSFSPWSKYKNKRVEQYRTKSRALQYSLESSCQPDIEPAINRLLLMVV